MPILCLIPLLSVAAAGAAERPETAPRIPPRTPEPRPPEDLPARPLPRAYGGCTCPCHRTPGMIHVVPCCTPGDEAFEPRHGTSEEDTERSDDDLEDPEEGEEASGDQDLKKQDLGDGYVLSRLLTEDSIHRTGEALNNNLLSFVRRGREAGSQYRVYVIQKDEAPYAALVYDENPRRSSESVIGPYGKNNDVIDADLARKAIEAATHT